MKKCAAARAEDRAALSLKFGWALAQGRTASWQHKPLTSSPTPPGLLPSAGWLSPLITILWDRLSSEQKKMRGRRKQKELVEVNPQSERKGPLATSQAGSFPFNSLVRRKKAVPGEVLKSPRRTTHLPSGIWY